MKIPVLFCLLLALSIVTSCKKHSSNNTEWRAYAGSKEGNRYSANEQITAANVGQLKIAWQFSSGDKDSANRSQNQCNPIMVDGILYATSPKLKLLALDAATGVQKWIFDPASQDTSKKNDPLAYYKVCRGVVYGADEKGNNKRIFYSAGSKTYAIDAENGQPIKDFGRNGYIDLTKDLGKETQSYVSGTTPGVIYKDILIVGARVDE